MGIVVFLLVVFWLTLHDAMKQFCNDTNRTVRTGNGCNHSLEIIMGGKKQLASKGEMIDKYRRD